MTWREAFLRQARSEQEVRRLLDDANVEDAHRLHYLQMVSEKLAKAYLADPNDSDPPALTHNAFVRLLQTLKGRRDVRRHLGFRGAGSFKGYIDSLLPLAAEIENLAPSSAGIDSPNPEYPWKDRKTNQIHVPVSYRFKLFDARLPRMIKLERLVDALLRMPE